MPRPSIQNLIFSLARKMKADADKGFAGSGVTLFQYLILKSIAEGCSTQNEIARRLGLKAPSLVPVIDSLLSEGYIKKMSDQKDKRKVRISLAPKARVLLKKVPSPSMPAFERALISFGDEKQKELTGLLEELTQKM